MSETEQTVMATKYTPTTEQVRDVYLLGCMSVDEKQELDVPEALAMFDRWRESLADAFEVAAAPFVATLRRELLEARELLQTRADHAGRLADEIAALKRGPRVLETPDLLHKEIDGVVIRSADGYLYESTGDGYLTTDSYPHPVGNIAFPVTVLSTPAVPS